MKKLIASLLIAATFQASAAGFVDGIVVANGATLSGQTSITGSADVPQLLLRANASQTQAIAKISNSTGLTDYFRINADGTITFSGALDLPTINTAKITITGTSDTNQLTVKANASQSTDIFKVTDAGGSTAYVATSQLGTTTFNPGIKSNSIDAIGVSDTQNLAHGFAISGTAGIGTLSGSTMTAGSLNSDYLSSKTANTALQIGAGLSGADTGALTLYTNGTGRITIQNGANTGASAIELNPLAGGVTIAPATNKDITLTTSGTGKTSVVDLTASGTITGNVAGTATNATNIAVTDVTTDATMYPLFSSATSGNTGAKLSSTRLTFNPLSGLLSSTGIINSDTWMQSDVFRQSGNTTSLSFNNTGSNSAANAIGITSAAGGITLTPASNKDLTLTTSGTGAVKVATSLNTINALVGTTSATAPTATTQLNISSPTQASARITLSGQEFYQAANTSTEGLSMLLGVNRSSDRELWLGRSDALTQNSTNPIIRFTPLTDAAGGSYIDSLGTDGTTAHILRLNPQGGAITTGTGLFTFGGNSYVSGTLNLPLADGNKILLLNSTTCARIAHSGGFSIDFTSGCTSSPSSGFFQWYTVNGSGIETSRMSLGNTGILTVAGGINLPTLTASQIVGTDGSKNLTSIATTGSGSVALATSPVLTTPNIGAATGTSLATTGNITINSGNQVVSARASGDLTGQTSTVSSIAAYTPSSTGTFDISGYIRCTAYTSGTIQLQVTYTDETNTSQTNIIPLVNTSGTPVTGANTGGFWSAMPRTIRANTSTPITVKTVGTFGATYDVGAYIHQAA